MEYQMTSWCFQDEPREASGIEGAVQLASEHQSQIPQRTENRGTAAHRLLIIASSGKTGDFRSIMGIVAGPADEPAHRSEGP